MKIVPKPAYVKILSEDTYNYSEDAIVKKSENHPEEGYRLVIDSDGVTSYASSEKGHFYALISFRQLALSPLPHCEIVDYPKYPYRGYMLDTCRHFFTVKEIKKQLDAIALLKINVFHWHLTEDQGWRIQIDKYPKLTEIGSFRKGTKGDSKPISGFYTKEDIKAVIEYAKSLHIDVMPEIDIPGHFSAAIAAYPFLSCDGIGCEVKETFGIHEEVCCAGKETSYEFLENVLLEVFELFPYRYIHLGGDEALRTKWIECADCQKKMADNALKNEDELQAFFMGKITDFAKKHGKTVINWNDGMVADNVHEDIIVHYWNQSSRNKEAALKHINAGHKGIISPFYSYYLDYPYGMTPLKKTYNYNPEKEGFDKNNIIGLETPLWTEYVQTIEIAEYMTYPRVVALAEKAWSGMEGDYNDFYKRMFGVMSLYDKMGIKYANPKEVNPRGLGRIKTLRKFLKNVKHPSNLESLARINKNKKMLKEKYGK